MPGSPTTILTSCGDWTATTTRAKARHLAPELRKSFANLEHVSIARPHFLALGLDMLPSKRADEYRAEGMPIVAWTVRSPAEWDGVKAHCDNLIFEGYLA